VKISVHDLRRTYLTVAASAGILAMDMKGLVNHSLGGDVTSGYVIMPLEQLRGAAQRVADHMAKLCNISEAT
jgi:hypothetical protein